MNHQYVQGWKQLNPFSISQIKEEITTENFCRALDKLREVAVMFLDGKIKQ